MRVTTTAIQRGITFYMIYLIAVGFGLFSLGRLKVDLYPDLTFPMISIITQYTGVGPFDMENVVTRPIEEVVASVQNVKTITSNSRQGLSLIMLEFDWGTDMNQAETDVRNVLEFVDDVLPDETTDPMVFSWAQKFTAWQNCAEYRSLKSNPGWNGFQGWLPLPPWEA
jgi:hydrophobic/amphiphilic exporter-1 (mainly G- bacteria), HAE1 family